MGAPSYDPETLAAFFHPLGSDLFDDPVVGPILRELQASEPDVIAAVADVDRSQIRDALRATPSERLRAMEGLANMFSRSRRGD
jgi:hypothetical protein